MAEQTTKILIQLEAALHAADQAELHAVAALIAQALELFVAGPNGRHEISADAPG